MGEIAVSEVIDPSGERPKQSEHPDPAYSYSNCYFLLLNGNRIRSRNKKKKRLNEPPF
jgi:hypothetical protein